MGKPFLKIDFNIENKNMAYKSVFNKLKTFLNYHATVGIHKEQGKQKVLRRYNKTTKSGKAVGKLAGVSHRMTISKLAYQNEFGATILIKPRYRIKRRTIRKESVTGTVNGRNYRVSVSLLERYYGKKRNASEQGFLLISKSGKFVMYKPPNSTIKIPSRSFIRKVVNEPSADLQANIATILANLFKVGGGRARPAWVEIATLVREEIKKNIHDNKPNHPITVKAKESSTPLKDEQDRIYKAIKFKLYKGGPKGDLDYRVQRNIKIIDKALKSIDSLSKDKVIGSETKYIKKFLK